VTSGRAFFPAPFGRVRRHPGKGLAASALAILLGACNLTLDLTEVADDDSTGTQPVSDWWRCDEDTRLEGSFEFGRVSTGCPVSEFGDPQIVRNNYLALIFDDSQDETTERDRYMDEMYSFLRSIARQKITNRKNPTATEIDEWQRAVFATAHQESFWTHYREPDPAPFLSMIRGDSGHGHGMLQVDDRFWEDALLEDDVGWRLEAHAIFALDILFDGWQSAPDSTCLDHPQNWRDRARSAYSAYNGGPSRICRWANEDNSIDDQFATKYDNRDWRNFVTNPMTTSLAGLGCPGTGGDGCRAHDRAGPSGARSVDAGDRPVAALAGTGDYVELTRDTALARSPGGAPLTTASADEVVQVLDVRIADARIGARYYRVARDGERYWLDAGDNRDHAAHATIAPGPPGEPGPIPSAGELWWVAAPDGIRLRAEPGGSAVGHVPHGASVSIRGVTVEGDSRRVHVRVDRGGERGWLYAGRAGPPESLGYWLSREPGQASP